MAGYLEFLDDNVLIDKTKCVYCGSCVETCILDNIRLKVSPCREACPLDLNCQGYVQLLARGDIKKAVEVIRETLPFPEVIGRICHHPCEDKCKRNEVDGQSVALRVIKRFLAEQICLAEVKPVSQKRLERVAVIGGGPAGSMAAYILSQEGYQVVVYEKSNKLGGMLSQCIPDFRLPQKIVIEEFSQLDRLGVQVKLNTTVGKDITFDEIVENFNAVIIAVGCQKSKSIELAGEGAKNVYGAVDFLKAAKDKTSLEIGKSVIVIGGGNTAIDAAQTAYRLGAKDIRLFCLEARDEMPAFSWEIKDALEEGIIIENGWGPDQFIVKDEILAGIEFKRCLSVFDKKGNFSPLYLEGERRLVPADTVIIAIGQEVDLDFLKNTGISFGQSYEKIDPFTLQTNISKVFACGDLVTGPKTAIEAIAQGRDAAESVKRFLKGLPLKYGRIQTNGFVQDFEINTAQAEPIPRIQPKKLPGKYRRTFDELEYGITKEQAMMEAKRCVSCGEPFGKYRNCWACLACEVECPEEAISVKVPFLMR
ncbi:MAG: FAD-dependent oxidoreductase [Bacillota bacterium]